MTRWTPLVLLLTLCAALSVFAQGPAINRKVTLELQNAPLKQALDSLFQDSGATYTLEEGAPNPALNVSLKDVEFETALNLLLRAAAPNLSFRRQGTVYQIGSGKAPSAPQPLRPPSENSIVEKIPINFARADDLIPRLDANLMPDSISSISALQTDNSLIVRGEAEDIQRLRETVRLLDVAATALALRAIAQVPAPGGRAHQIETVTRTLNGREATASEEGPLNGQPSQMRVSLKPVIQGDSAIQVDSEWELSLPLAGGKTPPRLRKRLVTSTRVLAGQNTVVGEVDTTAWGGTGLVRLWLRADRLSATAARTVYGAAGEAIAQVHVSNDVPLVDLEHLAASLGGRLRFSRAASAYSVIRDAPPAGESPAAGERPEGPGPYRLVMGQRIVSRGVRVARFRPDTGRLTPDPSGTPYVPLDDIAIVLGSRIQFDPVLDAYSLLGGQTFASLLTGQAGTNVAREPQAGAMRTAVRPTPQTRAAPPGRAVLPPVTRNALTPPPTRVRPNVAVVPRPGGTSPNVRPTPPTAPRGAEARPQPPVTRPVRTKPIAPPSVRVAPPVRTVREPAPIGASIVIGGGNDGSQPPVPQARPDRPKAPRVAPPVLRGNEAFTNVRPGAAPVTRVVPRTNKPPTQPKPSQKSQQGSGRNYGRYYRGSYGRYYGGSSGRTGSSTQKPKSTSGSSSSGRSYSRYSGRSYGRSSGGYTRRYSGRSYTRRSYSRYRRR